MEIFQTYAEQTANMIAIIVDTHISFEPIILRVIIDNIANASSPHNVVRIQSWGINIHGFVSYKNIRCVLLPIWSKI